MPLTASCSLSEPLTLHPVESAEKDPFHSISVSFCVSFIYTYAHACMVHTQQAAKAQRSKLSYGVLIVCTQAAGERKNTHHMDKLILLSI